MAPKRVLGGPDTQISLGTQNTNDYTADSDRTAGGTFIAFMEVATFLVSASIRSIIFCWYRRGAGGRGGAGGGGGGRF